MGMKPVKKSKKKALKKKTEPEEEVEEEETDDEDDEDDDEEEEEEPEEIEKPKTSKAKPEKPGIVKELVVVNELLTQPVTNFVDDTTGIETEFITRDEALKEILERLRKLDEED